MSNCIDPGYPHSSINAYSSLGDQKENDSSLFPKAMKVVLAAGVLYGLVKFGSAVISHFATNPVTNSPVVPVETFESNLPENSLNPALIPSEVATFIKGMTESVPSKFEEGLKALDSWIGTVFEYRPSAKGLMIERFINQTATAADLRMIVQNPDFVRVLLIRDANLSAPAIDEPDVTLYSLAKDQDEESVVRMLLEGKQKPTAT